MNRLPNILFPSILLGILAICLFAGLASTSNEVLAADTLIEITRAITTVPQGNLPNSSPSNAGQANAECSLPARYPAPIRQWCNWIEKYAHQVNLEPGLIAAVMLQESGGNPKAISSSGAVGLMQVMPRDGLAANFQCANGPCFAARPTTAQLKDPEFNISYGVRMLAGLVQKKGSLRDALRSYGPIDVGYSYADKVLRIHANYR